MCNSVSGTVIEVTRTRALRETRYIIGNIRRHAFRLYIPKYFTTSYVTIIYIIHDLHVSLPDTDLYIYIYIVFFSFHL